MTNETTISHDRSLRALVALALLAGLAGCGSTSGVRDERRAAKYGPFYDEDPTSGYRGGSGSSGSYHELLDVDVR